MKHAPGILCLTGRQSCHLSGMWFLPFLLANEPEKMCLWPQLPWCHWPMWAPDMAHPMPRTSTRNSYTETYAAPPSLCLWKLYFVIERTVIQSQFQKLYQRYLYTRGICLWFSPAQLRLGSVLDCSLDNINSILLLLSQTTLKNNSAFLLKTKYAPTIQPNNSIPGCLFQRNDKVYLHRPSSKNLEYNRDG